MSTGGGQGHR